MPHIPTPSPAMPELNVEEKLTIHYIDGSNSAFHRTDGGFLSLDFDGRTYPHVVVMSAFPFSDPNRYVSVRESDEKHAEIGIIKDLADLDGNTAAAIKEQLQLRRFTPKITRIFSAKDKGGFTAFDVDTDRGRCKFIIRSGTDSVIRLSDTRLIFCDIDSNRFEVENVADLPKKEQKKLDLYI